MPHEKNSEVRITAAFHYINIYPMVLVPHFSDQCQPFNLVTYGRMKPFMSSGQLTLLRSRHSQNLVRILGAWNQATSPHQVVSAFIIMELVYFLGEDDALYIRVDRGRAMQVQSWEGTIRNHRNFDEAAAGESAFQFSKILAIIVLHHPLNTVRPRAVSSKSRAKRQVLLNLALNQPFI
jgi:hypothetical protein